jgi:hypothetical protein
VHRKEIYDQICDENRQAAGALLAADSGNTAAKPQDTEATAAPVDDSSLRIAVKARSSVRSGS